MSWPPELPVLRVRWARPTDRLDEVVAFYRDGLGLAGARPLRGPLRLRRRHARPAGQRLPPRVHLSRRRQPVPGAERRQPARPLPRVGAGGGDRRAAPRRPRLSRRRAGEPVLGRPQHHDRRPGRLARRARLGPRRGRSRPRRRRVALQASLGGSRRQRAARRTGVPGERRRRACRRCSPGRSPSPRRAARARRRCRRAPRRPSSSRRGTRPRRRRESRGRSCSRSAAGGCPRAAPRRSVAAAPRSRRRRRGTSGGRASGRARAAARAAPAAATSRSARRPARRRRRPPDSRAARARRSPGCRGRGRRRVPAFDPFTERSMPAGHRGPLAAYNPRRPVARYAPAALVAVCSWRRGSPSCTPSRSSSRRARSGRRGSRSSSRPSAAATRARRGSRSGSRSPTWSASRSTTTSGSDVRQLAFERPASGRVAFLWNGRDDDGQVVPDGSYRARVRLDLIEKTFLLPNLIRVDTKPPVAKVVSVGPGCSRPTATAAPTGSTCATRSTSGPAAMLYVDGVRRVVGASLKPAGELRWYGMVGRPARSPRAATRSPSLPSTSPATVRPRRRRARADPLRRARSVPAAATAGRRRPRARLHATPGASAGSSAAGAGSADGAGLPDPRPEAPGRYLLAVSAHGHRAGASSSWRSRDPAAVDRRRPRAGARARGRRGRRRLVVPRADDGRRRSSAPPPSSSSRERSRRRSPARRRSSTRSRGRRTATTTSGRTSRRSSTGRPYRQLWMLRARWYVEFPPAVGYGKVFVSQLKGVFYAVDAKTGK